MDDRVAALVGAEELSIGDYVLSGGEVAALVVIDAVSRLVPGVVGDAESVVQESFADSLLDFPHYTRPLDFGGVRVPDVLRVGASCRGAALAAESGAETDAGAAAGSARGGRAGRGKPAAARRDSPRTGERRERGLEGLDECMPGFSALGVLKETEQ